MTEQGPVLLDLLAEIPDFRQAQGRRHPLPAILALRVAAMLCGYRSYGAIAEWGRNYGTAMLRALGFTHDTAPCAATLNTVLRGLDTEAVERVLATWAEGVLAATTAPPTALGAIAIDGKSLRGSRRQKAPGAHLRSALGHRLGLTMGQQAVADKTNEIGAIGDVLGALVVENRVITMDALLTQRDVAQTIVAGGGDYVMIVKGNQPTLQDEIATLFATPSVVTETLASAATLDIGHGRIEHRRITTSTALCGYTDWAGREQVFALERQVIRKSSGTERAEIVYGVTSLSREQASAAQVLELVRHHWHIENKSHGVRDVTYDEDRSQVRVGSIPQVMAALRNTAIGLMRVAGETNIAAACRRDAAQPWSALALIGISPRTE
jgi:predicted transposase YbfD/YdcC